MSQDIPHDSSPSALLGETVAPAQPGAVPVASTPTPTQVPVAVSVPERAAAPAGHEHAPQPAVTAAPSHAAPAPSSTTAPAHIPERTTAPPVASEPAPAPAPTANATHQQPTAPVERLQIINEKQEFTTELTHYMKQWKMLNRGFDYDVVSVFGSQSTGKSTLLNGLFGTTFDVMDDTRRRQTTKGIWMCPSAYSPALVMDVEGTDGRERGEDQDFERKSALFSLASSEVLLVNLWEHQIGLYQGANMGLLKTVFEVNLKIFGGDGNRSRSKEKTLILFVIRDHFGATPLASLAATLTESLDEIWAGLSKPAHLVDSALSDYFDLSFVGLPNKILQVEQFNQSIVELRKRFTDKSRPDYVFKPEYQRRIPADGLAHYMEGIWQQVLSEKDLDLPTQQELLAQFRCDEIAAGVVEIFTASSKAVRKPIEAGSVVDGLGGLMSKWIKVALTSFDAAASRYHSGVYNRKRQDLGVALHSSLLPVYLGQLKNAHKGAMAKFVADINASLKAPSYDFAQVVSRCTADARDAFLDAARDAAIDGSGWEYERELALLDEDLKSVADKSRADETKKMVNGIERTVKRQLLEPVEIALSKPSSTMWDKVLTTYNDVTGSAVKSYLAKAKSYNCTEEENATALKDLHTRSWLVLRKKLDEQTADTVVLSTLRGNFEERFRYDDSGVPRVWKPEDDLDGAFKKARDETLSVLPLYANIDPTDAELLPNLTSLQDDTNADVDPELFDPDTAFKLVSSTRMGQLETRFKREADAAYVEAKRSLVSSVSQIPIWVYGAMVVLGWNEAMAVLFNPIYFALLVVGLATAYIVLQLGLAGPLIQVSRTVLGEVKRIGTERLREAFAEPPQHERAHLAAPVPANDSVGAIPEEKRRDDHYLAEK